MKALIQYMMENVPDSDKIEYSVHCHNDLGMAVANALAGVQGGALQIECTVNGIGERAGNTSLEQAVMAMHTRPALFGELPRIDTKQIYRTSKMVYNVIGQTAYNTQPLVGANAFAHESGIHQHGVLANKLTYEILTPDSVGISKNQLVLGKHSGKHALIARIKELGYELDSDIIPATTSICVVDGDTYLAPYYGNVTVLLYNKANVEAAGYDGDSIESLDDILDICQKAKAAGKKGFIYRGDTQNNMVVDFLPILLSFGGWVLDDNNQPTVDSPEFKEAMNFYLELIATGEAQKKDDLIASCDTGAGTMGVGWPGWYTPTADSTADYCAITGAANDGDETYNANVYGVWTIGVPANSQNKEKAVELLSYLMDADVQKSTVPSGGVPCRYSSLQDPEVLATYPQYEVVCKALEGGVYRPVIAEWTQFYTILGTEMDNIVNGVKTVDAGLADAQAQLVDLMG